MEPNPNERGQGRNLQAKEQMGRYYGNPHIHPDCTGINIRLSSRKKVMNIDPKDPNSNWVAIDKNNKIIAEGLTPDDVIIKAKKTRKKFSLVFIPKVPLILPT
jgi:hypothetical protein